MKVVALIAASRFRRGATSDFDDGAESHAESLGSNLMTTEFATFALSCLRFQKTYCVPDVTLLSRCLLHACEAALMTPLTHGVTSGPILPLLKVRLSFDPALCDRPCAVLNCLAKFSC